jgi:DNA repair/transcription protein MET18/MMS19
MDLIDSALREMKDEFLVGVVDLMTGEKDPRNLMVVFSILKVVMIEWDISNHAEVSSLVISPSII